MKKLAIFCIVVSMLYVNLYAKKNANPIIKKNTFSLLENKGSVEGIVIDLNLKEPLPYVTVTLENSNGEILTGGITNDKGIFNINSLEDGKYIVKIQYIGYKAYIKEIEITRENVTINLGSIALEEDITSLNEVTVVAEVSSIEQRIDRKVINVGKDLITAG